MYKNSDILILLESTFKENNATARPKTNTFFKQINTKANLATV